MSVRPGSRKLKKRLNAAASPTPRILLLLVGRSHVSAAASSCDTRCGGHANSSSVSNRLIDSPSVIAECSSNTARRDIDEMLTTYGHLRHEPNLAWTPMHLWSRHSE